MFKRFVPAEDVSSVTAVKSSAVRAMKRSICDTYPAIEEFIDDILPKKGDAEVKEGKGKDRLTFAVVNGEPLFFRVREGPYFPTLKLLHKCACLFGGGLAALPISSAAPAHTHTQTLFSRRRALAARPLLLPTHAPPPPPPLQTPR